MINLATSTCAYCALPIVADIDERSTLDWGADGDYGCGDNPLSDNDGTWGHQPRERLAITLSDAVRGLFSNGDRGSKYISDAREIARALRLSEV